MTWTFIIAGLGQIVVAGAGAFLTDLTPWYRSLRKPSWQPPDWLFGPAWTLILALAAVGAALAWQAAPTTALRICVVCVFTLNGLLNVAWSLLFFKLRRPDWALREVGPLWLSILVPMIVTAPFSPGATWAMAPYLAWVAFAAFLNWTIVRLNRPFTGAVRHPT